MLHYRLGVGRRRRYCDKFDARIDASASFDLRFDLPPNIRRFLIADSRDLC